MQNVKNHNFLNYSKYSCQKFKRWKILILDDTVEALFTTRDFWGHAAFRSKILFGIKRWNSFRSYRQKDLQPFSFPPDHQHSSFRPQHTPNLIMWTIKSEKIHQRHSTIPITVTNQLHFETKCRNSFMSYKHSVLLPLNRYRYSPVLQHFNFRRQQLQSLHHQPLDLWKVIPSFQSPSLMNIILKLNIRIHPGITGI